MASELVRPSPLLAPGSMIPLCALGGIRFRRWIFEDFAGVPRYSTHVETIFLWLAYRSAVSIAILVLKQMMRRLAQARPRISVETASIRS